MTTEIDESLGAYVPRGLPVHDGERRWLGQESPHRRYLVEAGLALREPGFMALALEHSTKPPRAIRGVESLLALEALAGAASTRQAAVRYAALARMGVRWDEWLSRVPRGPWAPGQQLMLSGGTIEFHSEGRRLDLTSFSAPNGSVLWALLAREGVESMPPSTSQLAFEDAVKELDQLGVVSPAPLEVQWGDLRRLEPFCPKYGSGRGTIIDRYYLNKFLECIRQEVHGSTIEIGTSILTDENRLRCRFPRATEYRTLDVVDGPGVDICGTIENIETLAPESVDSFLCFNVLEHCAQCQLAVDNLHAWLRPDGKVFCMVPSVQRVHQAPRDYWRPLPDGLEYLFRGFRGREMHVYGNLQTTIAALAALAVEEVDPEVLDQRHPDYPVATCIVATK